jgi:hypothetical protein
MTNQTQNKSFILHKDSLSILNKLSDEEAGKLFKAIYNFQTQNILPTEKMIDCIFEPFLNQFKRDEEKYQNVVERNKINIAKRWNKPNTKNTTRKTGIPKDTKNTDSDSKNDSDSDSKNELIDINNFELFWSFYTPVAGRDGKSVDKGSKADAKKSYEKAIALNFTHEKIMQALEFYLKECQKNARFTKHAVSWLNQATRDEFKFEQSSVIKSQAPPQKLNRDQEQDRINEEFLKLYAKD